MDPLLSFATACKQFDLPAWSLRVARAKGQIAVLELPNGSHNENRSKPSAVLRVRASDAAKFASAFHTRKKQRKALSIGAGLMTVTEIAEATGVHEETVRRWIRNLELPARRVAPSGYAVAKKDLDAFLRRAFTK